MENHYEKNQRVSASGQTKALQLLEQQPFDLVLLDISLADGNGFAVCSAIKDGYSLPVIFLTASSDEYSTVTGFNLGADDYIAKPFRPRELVSRIKNILRLTGGAGKTMKLGDVLVDTVKGTASKAGRDLYQPAPKRIRDAGGRHCRFQRIRCSICHNAVCHEQDSKR